MATDETKEFFTPMISEAKALTRPADTIDLLTWLGTREAGEEAPRDKGLKWLLATTYGEVVWGEKDNGQWVLSSRATTLPGDELLEARAFGPDGEVFVWRDASGLRARLRADGVGGENCDTYEETQLMWGTVRLDDAPPGFTRLADGEQGLEHALPLKLDESYFITKEYDAQGERDMRYGHRPARLVLRHYIGRDKQINPDGKDVGTGLARVVDTRLVEMKAKRPTGAKQNEVDNEPQA